MAIKETIIPTAARQSALERIKPIARGVIRRLPGRRVRWGTMRRTRPFSNHFGWDRGLPVDREYIEAFLAANAHLIAGDAMEVRQPLYVNRFGSETVNTIEVVDIDASNPEATKIVDLAVPGSLDANAYDSIVFTQTLHLIADDQAVLTNLWRSLRPGGTLLLTAPSASRLDPESIGSDYWRYTPLGLETLVKRSIGDELDSADIHVEGFGNVLVTIAFTAGLAREELLRSEFSVNDPNFPLVACARVTKAK